MQQNTPGLLDQAIIGKAFGDDRSFICATMQIYMRDAPALARKAYESLQAGNNGELAANAHALKGITGYFTRGGMYSSCLELEMLGKNEGLPLQSVHALGLWSAINNYLRDMLDEMRDYMDAPQP